MTITLRRGFTLIEMLVVLAIIGVLAAILFPVFGRVRENARRSVCASNLHQIGVATQMYTDDYDHLYPYAVDPWTETNLDNLFDPLPNPVPHSFIPLLTPYTKANALLRCPSDTGWWETHPQTAFEKYGTSYDYNFGVCVTPKTREATVSDPSHVVLFTDLQGSWHGDNPQDSFRGGNYEVVFADLHVKRLPESRFWADTDIFYY